MTPAQQPQREYIITEEQIVKIGEAMTKWYLPDAAGSLCFLLRQHPHQHTPAPEQYKMQTDEDGATGKVAICLCDQCKVNGFLCTKSPRAITPYIPGKETPNTYRCCEVCPNVPCKPLFRVNCTRQDPEAIARAATLATLDEFEEWCKSRYVTQQIRDFKIYKSLRTAQEHP